MNVREFAREDVVSVSPDATLEEIAQAMYGHTVGSVVVEEDGQLVGIVTDRDLAIELLAEDSEVNIFRDNTDLSAINAQDVMTADPLTVEPDAEVQHVLRQMNDAVVRRIPVVDDDEVVGILTFDDLVVQLAGETKHCAAKLDSLAGVVRAESPDDDTA